MRPNSSFNFAAQQQRRFANITGQHIVHCTFATEISNIRASIFNRPSEA